MQTDCVICAPWRLEAVQKKKKKKQIVGNDDDANDEDENELRNKRVLIENDKIRKCKLNEQSRPIISITYRQMKLLLLLILILLNYKYLSDVINF